MLVEFEEFIEKFPEEEIAAAIGVFDGIHLGHQNLISKIKAKAQHFKAKSAIITFDPNPKVFLNKSARSIYSLADNYRIIRELGVDFVVYIKFNENIRSLVKDDFINCYLNRLKVKYLVSGNNFRFGFKAAGGPKDLVAYSESNNFKYDILELLDNCGEEVSSTIIKSYIENYKITKASKLLENFYVYFTFYNSHKKILEGKYILREVKLRSFLKKGIYTISNGEDKYLFINFEEQSFLLAKEETTAERGIVAKLITTVPCIDINYLASLADFALRI